MPDLYAFTDGACSGNPGPGGWGVLMQAKDGDTVVKERALNGGEGDNDQQPDGASGRDLCARGAARSPRASPS